MLGRPARHVTLRNAATKVLNIIRLLELGRSRRDRPELRTRGRLRTFRVLDAVGDEEGAFLGRTLAAPALMRRASRLLWRFGKTAAESAGSGAPGELLSLAADAIHQSKVCTARMAWREIAVPLNEELSHIRHKHHALEKRFNEVRTEYLREVVMLRDKARVRGDPEKCIQQQTRMMDVTFFFDPMNALRPHETEFALLVVQEKLKMIFETNPTVSGSVDLGQISRLAELSASSEMRKLRQALSEKSAELIEVRKEHERLVRQSMKTSAPSQKRSDIDEGVIKELEQTICDLRGSLEQAEEALHDESARCRHLERESDKFTRLREQSHETVTISQMKCRIAEEELRRAREEQRLTEEHEAELTENLRRLQERNRHLSETNAALRAAGEQVLQAPAHTVSPVVSQQRFEGVASTGAAPDYEDHELLGRLRRSDEQVRKLLDERDQMATRIADLDSECRRLRESLQQQAQRITALGAEAVLEQAEAFEEISQVLRQRSLSTGLEEGLTTNDTVGRSASFDAKVDHEVHCGDLSSKLGDSAMKWRDQCNAHEMPKTKADPAECGNYISEDGLATLASMGPSSCMDAEEERGVNCEELSSEAGGHTMTLRSQSHAREMPNSAKGTAEFGKCISEGCLTTLASVNPGVILGGVDNHLAKSEDLDLRLCQNASNLRKWAEDNETQCPELASEDCSQAHGRMDSSEIEDEAQSENCGSIEALSDPPASANTVEAWYRPAAHLQCLETEVLSGENSRFPRVDGTIGNLEAKAHQLSSRLGKSAIELRRQLDLSKAPRSEEEVAEWMERVSEGERYVAQLYKETLQADANLMASRVQGIVQQAATDLRAHGASSAARTLHCELNQICGFTQQMATKLRTVARENLQMREVVSSLGAQAHRAAGALQSSPMLDGDSQLQLCLLKVQRIESETVSATCSNGPNDVFGRLWRDGAHRQARRAQTPGPTVPSLQEQCEAFKQMRVVPQQALTISWPMAPHSLVPLASNPSSSSTDACEQQQQSTDFEGGSGGSTLQSRALQIQNLELGGPIAATAPHVPQTSQPNPGPRQRRASTPTITATPSITAGSTALSRSGSASLLVTTPMMPAAPAGSSAHAQHHRRRSFMDALYLPSAEESVEDVAGGQMVLPTPPTKRPSSARPPTVRRLRRPS